MKKKWIAAAAALLLILEAAFLIVERIIPRNLEDILPENYQPETGYIHYLEWEEHAEIEGEALQTLMAHLGGLEYRYDGRVFGAMYGQLYHVSLFQPKEQGLADVWIARDRGVVYTGGKEYEVIGDREPLLDFLSQLK